MPGLIISLSLIFQPGWVAGSAVFKVGNAFIEVDFGRFGRFMSMTIIACVFIIRRRMAGLTRNLAFIAMIQREGMAG
jgi:hypothetical protein